MQIYDLHVHTKLSNCADRNAEASEYITLASEYEFAALGFTDHAWDSPRISGATDWYKRQPYERILECNYARDGKELPIFRGAEGEYASYLLGVTEETIKKLDYIIIPHSHIHMKNFVISSTFDTPDKKAQFLLNSFVSLCKTSEARYIFGIAHPFFPCGVSRDELDEIMSHLKVSDMLAAFEIARKNEIFIEFNTSCFNILPNDAENYSYSKIMRLAKKAGCQFFLGSDRHNSSRKSCEEFVRLSKNIVPSGLCESDFTSALSHILNA